MRLGKGTLTLTIIYSGEVDVAVRSLYFTPLPLQPRCHYPRLKRIWVSFSFILGGKKTAFRSIGIYVVLWFYLTNSM